MSNNVCLGCTERHIGCHSECDRYNLWVKEQEARKKAIWSAKKQNSLYTDYKKERIGKEWKKSKK